MTTMQDCSIGFSPVEAAYATNTTVTRWLEFLSETLDFNKNIIQGKNLRAGTRVPRSARRVIASADAAGEVNLECVSKGMGFLLRACLGTAVSTLVSGSTFQQNYTLNDVPGSITVQKGLVQAGGTVDAYTFIGGMVAAWELSFGMAEIATLKATLDFKDVTTATAYAATSYAAAPSLFHFAQASLSTGTLTAPTTTALASAVTPVANVRGGTLQVNNNLTDDRYLIGGAGRKAKPTLGLRDIGGNLLVEYDSTTFRDAVMNDTPMSLVLTYTSTESLSTGFATMQVVLPELKLDTELPKSNAGDLIVQSVNFKVLDNVTAAEPIWVVLRTADSAI